MKNRVQFFFRTCFKIFLAALVALLLLEAGVRVILSHSLNRYLTRTLPQPYGEIMRRSGSFDLFTHAASHNRFDPVCYYVPRNGFFRGPGGKGTNPSLDKSFDIPKEKKKGEIRVLCIGDSTTYGWGVSYDQSWVYLLGKKLSEKYPGMNIVTLNAGVPGATSRQVKRIYQFYLSSYWTDILIWRAGDGISDAYLVNAALESLRLFVWRCVYESRVFRVLCVLLDNGKGEVANATFDFLTDRFGQDFARSQAAEAEARSDFEIVKKIAEENGVRRVLQVEYLFRHDLGRARGTAPDSANGNKVYVLEAFNKFRRENPSRKLFVDLVHLTEAGNAITAEEISKYIIEKNWIEAS